MPVQNFSHSCVLNSNASLSQWQQKTHLIYQSWVENPGVRSLLRPMKHSWYLSEIIFAVIFSFLVDPKIDFRLSSSIW